MRITQDEPNDARRFEDSYERATQKRRLVVGTKVFHAAKEPLRNSELSDARCNRGDDLC